MYFKHNHKIPVFLTRQGHANKFDFFYFVLGPKERFSGFSNDVIS